MIISIVSHNNQSMIIGNGLVSDLRDYEIICRENVPTANRLIGEAEVTTFIQNVRIAGFGANHNRNFEIVNPGDEDWFIVCNPDISVTEADIAFLLDLAEKDGAGIAAPGLWNNTANRFDDNVRPFPTISSLILSFAGFAARSRYDADSLVELENPDWASGAFLAIKGSILRQLFGFDERFFMYMEDVDFCRRAQEHGHSVHFYPQIQLVHNAARANRRIFSKNFKFHVMSIFKYFLVRGVTR